MSTPPTPGTSEVVRPVPVRDLVFEVRSRTPARERSAPVVLVHGIGMSHRYLARLARELARDRVVHTVDLPGFGRTPKPRRDVGVSEMSAGLGEVLDALTDRPVVLVGQSMGAQWAVELAAQRPGLVAHVVLLGPVVDDRRRTAAAQGLALALDALREPPATNAILLTDYLRCGPRWYLAQLRHMLRYRTEDAVAALTVPLLLVRGGRDPIAGRDWCRRLRDRALDAVLVTVPGGPHNVQRSRPRAVAAAVRAFVDHGGTA
ncbi:alpha/beta fold hydrolase [Microbacterium sp. GXF7504]